MEFKLNPAYLRSESEPEYQKIAWRPTWKCFCCQDSGYVRLHLIKTVIDNYDPSTQKLVKCNSSVCIYEFGEKLLASQTLDNRFPTFICDRFDLEERQTWREWSKEQYKLRKVDLDKATRNLRSVNRSNHDHLEAQRKHEEYTR